MGRVKTFRKNNPQCTRAGLNSDLLVLDSDTPRLIPLDLGPEVRQKVTQFRNAFELIPAGAITMGSFLHPEFIQSPRLPFIQPVRRLLLGSTLRCFLGMSDISQKCCLLGLQYAPQQRSEDSVLRLVVCWVFSLLNSRDLKTTVLRLVVCWVFSLLSSRDLKTLFSDLLFAGMLSSRDLKTLFSDLLFAIFLSPHDLNCDMKPCWELNLTDMLLALHTTCPTRYWPYTLLALHTIGPTRYMILALHATGPTRYMILALHATCPTHYWLYTLPALHATGLTRYWPYTLHDTCPTHYWPYTLLALHTIGPTHYRPYTLLALHATGLTRYWPYTLHDICPTHYWPYTLLALHTIGPTHYWPYTLLALHATCPTHYWPYTLLALHATGPTTAEKSNSRNLRELAENNPEAREILLRKAENQDTKHAALENKEEFKKVLHQVDVVLDNVEKELSFQSEDKANHWLCCERFTVADVSLTILLDRLARLGLATYFWGADKKPYLKQYYHRVQLRDSYKKTVPSTLLNLKMLFMMKTPLYIGIGVVTIAFVVVGGVFLFKKSK
uniref:GST C-terminal domain-containing protein n=1 Tax=Timema poppense TaxID=170557 RepID=A0A7R9CSV7_TIMPO|nr:unnamed protein product [Timema poppensis]